MKAIEWLICAGLAICGGRIGWGEPLLINHQDTDITALTESQIERAKSVLHIAYGHTSHGSQLTDGMSGLVGFANGGGLGMSFPADFFAWNNGGSGGALDLHDYAMDGDCGYYPDWVQNTTNYLNDSANSNVNVILWSWCGQMDDKYSAGTLTNEYLQPMADLEGMYPDVAFVYMTGHVDIWDDADNKAACEVIRDWCSVGDRILYDFNDIEHYDPDGNWFEWVNDSCDLYAYAGGTVTGNWATAWQDSHVENVDWYDCGAAHSLPLNANRKAYAAWALWCRLAADMDRDGLADAWEEQYGGVHLFGAGTNNFDGDALTDWQEYVADLSPTSAQPAFAVSGMANDSGVSVEFPSSTGRVYSLHSWSNLNQGGSLVTSRTGTGSAMMLKDDHPSADNRVYGIGVSLPD